MIEIEEELNRIQEKINHALEKYFPRKINKDKLIEICGKPRYDYEIESINKSIFEPLWNLLDRGGKRWRPALFLWTCEALGLDSEKYIDYAIIPEIIHNGTLVIDDIEDKSFLRRGKPAIHLIYGEDVAINMGNTMYYLPIKIILNRKELDKEKKLKLLETYIQEMINLSIGQAMDITWHKLLIENITEKQYLQMCSFKTGSLSRMAVKMAAILANANEEKINALSFFAESLGIAFQIQDDILNIIGNEKIYGKEIGGDISEGKITLMVVYIFNNAPEKISKRLLEILKSHTNDPKIIKEAINILIEYKAVEYAKNYASKLAKDAWNAINQVLPDSKAKKCLESLTNYLIIRKF
jgi:geranylgeranyl pyrophosphate synthase